MIDLTSETLVPLMEAAKHLPPARSGKPVHFSALCRWAKDGVLDASGRRVRLEAVRVGGRRLTSREALQRFAEALSRRPGDAPATPAGRRRHLERVDAELTARGL